MRIATWNCQGALDRKIDVLRSFSADVAVIQECASVTTLSDSDIVSSLWRTPGRTDTKGIGVFGFNGWTVAPSKAPVDMPWVLPARVTSPDGGCSITLLAIWTNTSRGDGRPPYAAQVAQTISAWEPHLAGPVLIAGDFNGSAQGPDIASHASNIAELERLRMRSAYHSGNQLGHGHEHHMTLKWIGKGRTEHLYHCDFIFTSPEFRVNSCEVMSIWDQFPKQPSDHQPVIADLNLIESARSPD